MLSLPAIAAVGVALAFPSQIFAAPSSLTSGSEKKAYKPITSDELGDCNWMVTYRGRTYDLAPLTREALSRPIETDLRYALQRVPESNEHLLKMTAYQRDAKAHTILASVFLSGLLLTRFALQAPEKDSDKRRGYDKIIGATGGFFLAATLFSWRSTRNAKSELVQAVDAFNRSSPYKMEPVRAESETEFEIAPEGP